MPYCTESIITTLSLHRCLATPTLIAIEIHHGYDRQEVLAALEWLIVEKRVGVVGDSLHLLKEPVEEIPANYLAAADQYRRAHHPTWRDRVVMAFANGWARVLGFFDGIRDRIMGGLVLLIVTTFLTLGLCNFGLSAEVVPDRIVAALVQVESGCQWHGVGDVRGTRSHGDAGEVSAFQLSPIALTAMGAADRVARIHRDPVLAESFARLWLARCFAQAGTWEGALARYNAGSRHRSRTARDYAARVLNLAAVL